MKKSSMLFKITLAVIMGIFVGIFIPSSGNFLKIIGDIFLRLMQMTIPILILGQIIQAVASINAKELTNLGSRTIIIFGVSSFLASLWGVLLAVFFKPGTGIDVSSVEKSTIQVQDISITESILNFVPKNIFESLTSGSIIQIIISALFFGFALNRYLEKNAETQILNIIVDFNDIVILIIKYVMHLAPLGIFSLITAAISNLGIQIILPLVRYLVVYGFATFSFMGIWILIIILYCQVNPIKLILNMKEMTIMALATTSSAITLPVALDETEHKLGIHSRVTNLVLPLGMSLNSNGSAMHMAITVITISQMYQFELSATRMMYLAIMVTFVSLANAVVPGAGLVSLAIIVPQIGLPIESIAIFAGVEWFVGILRTVLNVNSDVYSAILVAKSTNEIDYRIFNS